MKNRKVKFLVTAILFAVLYLTVNIMDSQNLSVSFACGTDSTNINSGGYFCRNSITNNGIEFFDLTTYSCPILSWVWTFQGAASDTEISYSSYQSMVWALWTVSGNYRVTLTVTDTCGNQNTLNVGVVVTVGNVFINGDTSFLYTGVPDTVNVGTPIIALASPGNSYFWWNYGNQPFQPADYINGDTNSLRNVIDTGLYTVYYNNNGCNYIASVYVIDTTQSFSTGMNNISSPQKYSNVFPNPASDFINVDSKDITKIVDLTGKILLTSQNSPRIDINFLPNGMYLVNNQKLVVQRN